MTEYDAGLGWTNEQIRELAKEFITAERLGIPLSYTGEQPLPSGIGLELDGHTGFVVRSLLPKGGVCAAHYLDAGGFMRAVWVRPIAWDTLPYETKRELWESETVAPGSDYEGVLYQAATLPANKLLFWDETLRPWYYTSPEAAVFDNTPWRNIEEWEEAYAEAEAAGRDWYSGEPLRIMHIAFALAEIMRVEELEERLARREAAEAEKEANRQAERARREKWAAAFEDGRKLVTYRKGQVPTTWLQKDNTVGTAQEDGFLVVLAADKSETSFGVRKQGRGQNAWYITHVPTGLKFPDFGFSTRDDALAIAGMLYQVWDNWGELKSGDDMPADAREAAVQVVVQSRHYMGGD